MKSIAIRIKRLRLPEAFHKISELYNGDSFMMFEFQEMVITRDKHVRIGQKSAFQDSIVRFILENVQVRSGFQNRCCLADRFQEMSDLFVRPPELGPEFIRGFRENEDRTKQCEISLNGIKKGFFSLASRDHESRDEDIGIENGLQTQRSSNTIFSTSVSVRTPCSLANEAP